jgi:hypothetical protein
MLCRLLFVGLLGRDFGFFLLLRLRGLMLAERFRLTRNLRGSRGRSKRLRALLVTDGAALFFWCSLNGRRRRLPLNGCMTLLHDVR